LIIICCRRELGDGGFRVTDELKRLYKATKIPQTPGAESAHRTFSGGGWQ
jgi:hypothetical protein